MWFLLKGVITLELMVISQLHAQDRSTALHLAAFNGNHEICQFLIEHGASVDAQEKVRDNPYQEYALCKL